MEINPKNGINNNIHIILNNSPIALQLTLICQYIESFIDTIFQLVKKRLAHPIGLVSSHHPGDGLLF